MPAQKGAGRTAAAADTNQVLLRGRLSGAPQERALPSGDTVWTFRVVVTRPTVGAGQGVRCRVDTIVCAVWSGRVRRSMPAWRDGDMVEVAGSLRRRFFRAGATTTSRMEVDVGRARVIRRAASG